MKIGHLSYGLKDLFLNHVSSKYHLIKSPFTIKEENYFKLMMFPTFSFISFIQINSFKIISSLV